MNKEPDLRITREPSGRIIEMRLKTPTNVRVIRRVETKVAGEPVERFVGEYWTNVGRTIETAPLGLDKAMRRIFSPSPEASGWKILFRLPRVRETDVRNYGYNGPIDFQPAT